MDPVLRNKNIDKCCRTCLNDVSSKFYELFGHYQNSITLAEMLLICTSISVLKKDTLPKKLCGSCYNCLVSFYDFKIQAEKVEDVLKNSQDVIIKSQTLMSEERKLEIKIEIENVHQIDNQDYFDNLEHNFNDPDVAVTAKEEDLSQSNDQSYCNVLQVRLENCYEADQTTRASSYKCKVCDKKFRTLSKLQKHEAKHNQEEYPCSFCPETFIHEYELVRHLVQHSQKKEESMLLEVNQNESNQSLKCGICSVSFKSGHSLSAHMRVHVEKGRILSCRLCNKVFKKLSHLKRHELSHEVNRPFKCSTCPKSFLTESLLNEHTNRHHGIKPHQCPLCSKAFCNISGLTTHLKIHTRGKIYLCSTCGKKFNSSTNLHQHMKRHLGLKTFSCNLCPKSFVSKGELKSHSNTHTGEKFYTCDQCGAAFTKRTSLGKHKLRHLGIKPHQCETCSRKFSSKDHLKRHYRIHTGEKPYRCEICERAFTQSNDLVKHRRAHLGDKLYRCDQCTESFRLKNELRHHISEHYISSRLQGIDMNGSSQICPNNNVNEKDTTLDKGTDVNKDGVIINIGVREKSALTLSEVTQ